MTKDNMHEVKICSVVVEKSTERNNNIDKKTTTHDNTDKKTTTHDNIDNIDKKSTTYDNIEKKINKIKIMQDNIDNNNNTCPMNEEKSLFPSIEIPATILPWNKKLESASEPAMKKYKRKKGNLDQLLPQVEAKKRREERLNSRCEASTPFSAFRPIMSKRHTLYLTHSNNNNTDSDKGYPSSSLRSTPNRAIRKLDETKPAQNLSPSPITKSNSSPRMSQTASHHDEDTDTENKMREEKNLEEKLGNKRTTTANERYSKLTSSQLQRRLVANARERSRVHALSNAFNSLRVAIPSYSTEQKLSKLTILRVAINYINALHNVLQQDPQCGTSTTADFTRYVEECSSVLQTEYGRSKSKHGLE